MMKNIFTLFTLFFLFHSNANSQISQYGEPYSASHSLKANGAKVILEKVSETWKINQENNANKNGTVQSIAKNIPTDLNRNNSGHWTALKNGDKIWRLEIKAEEALGLNLLFKDFYLPKKATLHIYNKDKTQVLGAFTEANNHESKLFSSEIIFGNTLILEYYENHKYANQGSFTIEKVGSFYRDLIHNAAKGFGDSENCQVSINCSPEGDNWQDEKRGVARILVVTPSAQGWCSGTLVNNTNTDCKPYFLTAYHCGNNSTTANFNQWVFYFNYEFSGCASSTSEPSSNTITGAAVISRSNDLTTGITSSDFMLLELNSSVPQSYNVYYNGWNSLNTAPSSGVSIHHPAGDVKKISQYNTTPTTVGVSWAGAGYSITSGPTHWSHAWNGSTNGHGVTEGGSSGSPMFNDNGLVIGTLSGGGSFCSNTSGKDQYGKMSYHWESNANSNSRKLKPWLDPTNSGVTSLVGTYSPCNAGVALDLAITEIISPKGDYAGEIFTPQVVIKNLGTSTITSATISYQVNSSAAVNFNWTGSLISNASETVILAIDSSSDSTNTFTATVSMPNGTVDPVNNNTLSSTFNTNVRNELPEQNTFEYDSSSANWQLINNDNDVTWALANIGSFGTSDYSMYMDNWDYDASGAYDWFFTTPFSFTNAIDEVMTFDYAYTYYKQTNVENYAYDTLGIAYSLDLGTSFEWIWKKGGKELATRSEGKGIEFVPQNSEWATESIDLTFLNGEEDVVFAFISINGYGNNLYVDNITIGKVLLSVDDIYQNDLFNDLKLFPNPANDNLTIDFKLENSTNGKIEVFNSLGKNMYSKDCSFKKKNTENISLNSFANGMYYLKITSGEKQIVKKFIKQ